MASRANFVPARVALDNRSSLLPITSVILGDLPSTRDLMRVPAWKMDTVERKRIREARNMRSGDVDFWKDRDARDDRRRIGTMHDKKHKYSTHLEQLNSKIASTDLLVYENSASGTDC